jgi:hypothetical protein
MKSSKKAINLLFLLLIAAFALYIPGCSDSVSTNETDEQYLMEVVQKGVNAGDEDDLLAAETSDLDDGGAVDNGPGMDTPIDSLLKWGRKIIDVNVNLNITSQGDTTKTVIVTKTITGNFIIIGFVNGVKDTIVKPYTEVLTRNVIFKRIGNGPRPRSNWKLYKVSMADGKTTMPQVGTDYVEMNKIEVYVDNELKYTFLGPDFTQNIFTTRRFGGEIPNVNSNDNVRLKVYTYSTQSEPDIVTWHWAKNAFGFHRVPFDMTSNIPSGSGWARTYEKTFTVYGAHLFGRKFNAFISASTHKSLYDDSPTEFASDLVGIPYRVEH